MISCFAILGSCNESNSLKQDRAEDGIRKYLSANSFETSQGAISSQTIQSIGKTNIFTQFNTSVKVYFNSKEPGQKLALLFIFTRTTGNDWFLESIESLDNTVPEITDWVRTRKNLKIAIQ